MTMPQKPMPQEVSQIPDAPIASNTATPLCIGIFDTDHARASAVAALLEAQAYRCLFIRSAADLLSHREQIDILVLDAETLMQKETFAPLIAAISALAAAAVPALLITTRAQLPQLQAARAAGAADYLLKPMRQGELLLRVGLLAAMAYPQHAAQQQQRYAQYVFETPSRRIVRGATVIKVTHKEFDLALLLFANLNRPLSRAYIQEAIWSGEPEMPTRTLDTHISRVRNKLKLVPENGFQLTPVYGYGYQLAQTGADKRS